MASDGNLWKSKIRPLALGCLLYTSDAADEEDSSMYNWVCKTKQDKDERMK